MTLNSPVKSKGQRCLIYSFNRVSVLKKDLIQDDCRAVQMGPRLAEGSGTQPEPELSR